MIGAGRGRKSAVALGVVSMGVLFAGPALIARASAAPASQAKAAEGHPKPIYHLELTVWSCRANLLLNGFPLISLSAENEQPVTFSPPVNPYLVGKRNTVEIELRPAVRPDGTELPFADANFEMEVQEYQQGGIVEPGGGGTVTKFSMPASVRKRLKRGKKLKLPLEFKHRFANGGGIDFSAELLDTAPFTDKKAVADYAMHLRDLMAKGDVDGLMEEYEPTIRVGVEAYGKPYRTLADNTRKDMLEFLKAKPQLQFGIDDLDVRPWCGGRIWQLSRKEGKGEFLRTADGTIRVVTFVAPRNGKLRVVR